VDTGAVSHWEVVDISAVVGSVVVEVSEVDGDNDMPWVESVVNDSSSSLDDAMSWAVVEWAVEIGTEVAVVNESEYGDDDMTRALVEWAVETGTEVVESVVNESSSSSDDETAWSVALLTDVVVNGAEVNDVVVDVLVLVFCFSQSVVLLVKFTMYMPGSDVWLTWNPIFVRHPGVSTQTVLHASSMHFNASYWHLFMEAM